MFLKMWHNDRIENDGNVNRSRGEEIDDHEALLQSMRADMQREARRARRTFETTGQRSTRRRR